MFDVTLCYWTAIIFIMLVYAIGCYLHIPLPHIQLLINIVIDYTPDCVR